MCRNLEKKTSKIEDECHTFNTEWTYKYFFTNFGSKAVCLICQKSVAIFKEYNLKRHFQTKHGNFGSNLSESKLQQKASDMVKNLKQQQTFFCKTNTHTRGHHKSQFRACLLIAQHNKPFSDGEFVKECMLDAVDITCPEVRTKIEAISLSRRTIVHRIGGIAQNLSEQLFEAGKSFEWYSLALDVSTGIKDTAQLPVFIRGFDENFEIIEELLLLEHLKDTTTGQNLFESVENCLDRSGLPLYKLASITTDGAPALTGKNVGLMKLLNDKVKREHPLYSVMSLLGFPNKSAGTNLQDQIPQMLNRTSKVKKPN